MDLGFPAYSFRFTYVTNLISNNSGKIFDIDLSDVTIIIIGDLFVALVKKNSKGVSVKILDA